MLAGAVVWFLEAGITIRADAQAAPPVVEPVVLIDAAILAAAQTAGVPVGDRYVRGCGVRAIFPGGPVIELVNMRSGDGLELQLTGHGFQGPSDDGMRVTLRTSGEITSSLLPPTGKIPSDPAPGDAGSTGGMRIGARGTIDPDAGARLFQQFMIGGATVTIDRASGGDILTVPGPLPHAVRTGFLNCSGDLFPRTR